MDDLPLSLLLDKIARANGTRLSTLLDRTGLRPKHAGLLSAVSQLRDPSQAQVAAWLGVSPSLVVGIVDELVERGLLQRTSLPGDRRRFALTLTPEGEQAAADATAPMRQIDEELLAPLSPDERDAFSTALLRIAARLGIAGTTL